MSDSRTGNRGPTSFSTSTRIVVLQLSRRRRYEILAVVESLSLATVLRPHPSPYFPSSLRALPTLPPHLIPGLPPRNSRLFERRFLFPHPPVLGSTLYFLVRSRSEISNFATGMKTAGRGGAERGWFSASGYAAGKSSLMVPRISRVLLETRSRDSASFHLA